MSEIPRDIIETGRKLAGEVNDWLKHGNSVGHLSEHAVAGLADSFSRALHEERKRCAMIAQEMPKMIAMSPAHVRAVTPADIALAIRQDRNGE